MILRHVDIVQDTHITKNCTLTIKNGMIHAVDKEITEQENRLIVVPGFIDQHIHVSSGHFQACKSTLYKHGVTSFVPTVATTTVTHMKNELKALAQLIEQDDSAIGIHLEGPFINKAKAGAQTLRGIVEYDQALLDELIDASQNRIKIITFAPECVDNIFYQTHLKIRKQIGHSEASKDAFLTAYKNGVKTITHVFNGLPQLHHRQDTILLESFLKKDMTYELIADKVHVSPSMIKFFLKQNPHLLLVSDALCDKDVLKDTKLSLKENHYYKEDGTLAGSHMFLDTGFKTVLEAGLNIVDAVKATSTHQSEYLGVDDVLGKIKVGYQADIVLLDETYHVIKTLKKGDVVYERGEMCDKS